MKRLGCALLLTLASACSDPETQANTDERWPDNCRVQQLAGHCLQHEVWENRQTKAGRRIELNVFVLPAFSANPAPDPVFFLAGGPGQSATQVAPQIAPVLNRIRRQRDLVFVDQRGTGKSNPLRCDLGGDDGNLQEMFQSTFPEEEVDACLAQLEADTRHYATPNAMDDLDEVRARLGYESINLIGASYGTRAALVYARRHPTRVRSLVLDGLAPTTMRLFLDFLPDAQRALDLLFEHCRASKACHKSFPELKKDFQRLVEKLKQEPAQTELRHPVTGKTVQLEISAEAFLSNLRGLLYSAELGQLLPLLIEQALEGNFEPFAAQVVLLSAGVRDSVSLGLLLSVACAEDVDRISAQQRDAAARESFVPASMVGDVQKACARWPHATMPPEYHQPVKSDAPALLLSGEIDPATPPRWGNEALKSLSQGRHLVVSGAGHGTLAVGCVPKVVASFIEQPGADVDSSCLDRLGRPPFFVDALGPGP